MLQPVLVGSQLLQCSLRFLIFLRPSWPALLAHRVGGMFAWYAFDTASSAALSDTLAGNKLAAAHGKTWPLPALPLFCSHPARHTNLQPGSSCAGRFD